MNLALATLLALAAGHSAPPVPSPAKPGASPAFAGVPSRVAEQKLWVYFTDKGFSDQASDAAVAALADSADPRTLQRRSLRRTRPGLFDATDLPVAPGYRTAVEATGARVHVESRWLNAVSVRATPPQAAALRALPCVARVEPVRGGRRVEDPDTTHAGAGGSRAFYGLAQEQLDQINVPALHAQGFTGAGVVVGVLDTGFRTDHAAFHQPGHELQVVASHDFINNDAEVGVEPGDDDHQHVHGTLILGCLAAYLPDELVGGAYAASFILCKTEDVTSETPIEEDNYVAGLEFIESHGGDMASASLGYIDWYSQSMLDGQTAVTTIAVNIATQNGLHVCNAAGNGGNDADPQSSSLIAPADALQVITCGAVFSWGDAVYFSSSGPTADGRVKPELLARGVDTYTIWPYDTAGYASANGTSLSTPLVACAVACLVQARPRWTVGQMRSMLFATASDQAAHGQPDPLYVRGYGIVNAADAAALDCNGNGLADPVDVQQGTSLDTDGDGTLNECEGSCPSDFDGSGFVDTDDYDAFVHAFEAGDASTDVDASGFVDTDDFDAFVRAFEAGC